MPPPILLTRPPAQIGATARTLRQHGHAVIEMPLTRIMPPSRPPGAAQRQLAHAARVLIFTSRNAVAGASAWLRVEPRQTVLAIGNATASAVESAGWPVHWTAPEATTESLLTAPDAPALHSPVVILGGSGGRRSLKAGLQARGLTVHKLCVYRRQGIRYSRDEFLAAVRARPILVFSSGHGMRQWLRMAQDYELREALTLPVFVASQRLCKLARQLGFNPPAQALPRMSDNALLAALNEQGT